MNIAKYSELTGITVTNVALTTAQINRTRYMLETMLGYSLSTDKADENLYNELGKTQRECWCPATIDVDALDAPDNVEGTYRLFDYNHLDKYFFVDPFVTLYKVKLVQLRPGEQTSEGSDGVTIKTFTDDELRVHMGRDSWAKYIEYCLDCLCSCSCKDCVQLAVEADWLNQDCIPRDLQYVWADMVTYYVDCKKDIKSESVTTHSYTKFDRQIPELFPQNIAVIDRYAGPHGTAGVMPV